MVWKLSDYICGTQILVNIKCMVMAKILQLICMMWSFMSSCFFEFWTYMGKRQKQRNMVEDILKWQREEVTKLYEVLNAEQVLNKKQCINLVAKLDDVVLNVNKIVISTKENSNKFGLVLEELCCITRKVRMVVEDCGKQESCHVVAFHMNSTEVFRELVDDLKYLWDAMCTRDFFIDVNFQNCRLPCIDFHVASCEEIESDEKAMVERLEKWCQTMPNGSKDYDLARHLLRRLKFDLQGGQGVEFNALEVPQHVGKPELLKELGSGSASKVYESNWLGLRSATKLIATFNEEAAILACLSHPNLVIFICCGRLNEWVVNSTKEPIGSKVACEVNKLSWLRHQCATNLLKALSNPIKCISWGTFNNTRDISKEFSKSLFLVMELMETSLSDFLKKQKTPLPYLVAINIMLEIAKGVCYLHDMQVAHLDIKPGNVLLSCKSRFVGMEKNIGYDFVKLTDYDRSKTEVQSKPELQVYTIGSPKYMAPEMNNPKKTNVACPFAADVWSFAMTCSEILSCEEPCTDRISTVILKKIEGGWRPNLPANCKDLTTLIKNCWFKDPSQRPNFVYICENLTILKKKFMVGTYRNDRPEFGKYETPCQIEEPKAPDEEHKKRTPDGVVVGLQSNLANVGDHLKEVNILGLIGMGGIGKTTLAKAVFDAVKCTYNESCFIENLKKRNSLEILCEILKNIGSDKQVDWELVHVQQRMRELLATKKILLILDDPKDADQVDDIIPTNISCFNNGTKIIITTRDWGIIKNRVDVNGKIDVGKLDEDAAKELFDSYVLQDGAQLSPQLDDLRGKIIGKCDGLPLSLKIMGAFLRGKRRIRSWVRAFQRMKRGRCLDGDEGLWSILTISFEDLQINQKNMFLDIACLFPKGMEKERALHIFTKNDKFPNDVLDVLVNKSLVVINKNGCLEMHDQLRDMGRRIAEKDIYKGTRIWENHTIPFANTSTCDKKNKDVEGIYLDEEILQTCLMDRVIENLVVSSLRILICWRLKTSLKSLETMTSLKTICLLESPSLTTLPEGIENLTSLTTLDLHSCSSLKTFPNSVANMSSLTTLNLHHCLSLTSLPEGLGNLSSLTTLDLGQCGSLTVLPTELGNLKSLTTLDLQSCSKLKTLPEELGNLISLKTMDLQSCSSLTSLPEGLGNLISLTTLDLRYCSSLTTLPRGLGNLTLLRTLDLHRCSSLTTLPEELGNLISLKNMDLQSCSSLTSLPEGLGNLISLTTLDLRYCSSLTILPRGLGNLTLLRSLDLHRCSSLTTLPEELGNLISLKNMDLQSCSSLTSLPEGLGNLISLTTLDLRYCSSLTILPRGLGNLTLLRSLDLHRCSSLTTLPEELGNLISLKTLDLVYCSSLVALPMRLDNWPSLTMLNLQSCSSLVTLPEGLGDLTSLTSLELPYCSRLIILPMGLGKLTSLTTLNLRNCFNLTALPEGLGNLISLTSLDLRYCSSLSTLPKGLGNLISLTTLDMHHCSSLTTLPEGLGNLTSLTIVDLHDCWNLTTLPKGLGMLTSLTSLDLYGCGSLRTLDLHH